MPLSGESSSMDSEVSSLLENDTMCRIYLRHAYQYAQAYSKDPSTQLGAILVQKGSGVIGWGVNALPSGISDSVDKWTPPQKYQYIEHAERNEIYCPWFACTDCARAIIQSKISAVVGHKQMYDLVNERWSESIKVGMEMIKEAGIQIKLWDGKIGNNISVRVNKKDFSP